MVKRRVAVVAFLICFCFLLSPCSIQATSTTEASEPINVEQECTLALSYTCDGTAFTDVPVKLYKIAEVSADFQYTLTSSFTQTNLVLNGIQSTDEWNVMRSTLEAHIFADNIEADIVEKTDLSGLVCFASLKPGLYLAVVETVIQEELNCCFDSALVALPGLGTDGLWQYQVSVASKSEIIPPIDADEEIQLKVIKLWKDDEKRNSRPKSVVVEIFRDGTSYKQVVLSSENNWSYSWLTKRDGANWVVIERNTPSSYAMTVEQRENSFVVTNTFVSPNPNGPIDEPKTGDTSNLMFYVVLMIISGSVSIILGIIGKRNDYEESK